MLSQRGISLVELLVSLLLSSLLMVVLIQHYLSIKGQYLYAQTALEDAFELQLVNNLLRESIRQAGFTPCLGLNWLTTYDSRNKHNRLVAVATNGGKHSALQSQHMDAQFALADIVSSTQLLLSSKHQYPLTQPVLIADCYHAEVHILRAVTQTAQTTLLTLAKPLMFNYRKPVYFGAWVEEQFFVQTNSRGKPALFYQLDHPEELSAQITAFTSSLTVNQEKLLVHTDLKLLSGQHLKISTKVRTP